MREADARLLGASRKREGNYSKLKGNNQGDQATKPPWKPKAHIRVVVCSE